MCVCVCVCGTRADLHASVRVCDEGASSSARKAPLCQQRRGGAPTTVEAPGRIRPGASREARRPRATAAPTGPCSGARASGHSETSRRAIQRSKILLVQVGTLAPRDPSPSPLWRVRLFIYSLFLRPTFIQTRGGCRRSEASDPPLRRVGPLAWRHRGFDSDSVPPLWPLLADFGLRGSPAEGLSWRGTEGVDLRG